MSDLRDFTGKNRVFTGTDSEQISQGTTGQRVASGSGEKALGDPVNVMLWLANQQRKKEGLRSGSVVSTGTCTGLHKVKSGDSIRLVCGAIGDVTAMLESAPIKLNN